MDFETVSAADFGRSLTGLGVNLLSPDVRALAAFLSEVFGLTVHRLSDDFAIVTHDGAMFQSTTTGRSAPTRFWVSCPKPRRAGVGRSSTSSASTRTRPPCGRKRRGTWCRSLPPTNRTGCANAPC
jgi:hypothetical protein